MSELPQGWAEATIKDATEYVQRGKSPKYASHSDLPVINQKCVRWTGVDEAHLKYVDASQWASWTAERFLRDGDILWNSTGTGTIGRAAIFRPLATAPRAVADSHVTIVRTNPATLPEYLHRFIQSPSVQSKLDDMQSGSTNQVELSKSEVLETSVPLPPLPEQRRIVAKIDSLTGKSRRARDHLDHIPRLVEKYKQAVLAAAFSGRFKASASYAKNRSVSEALDRLRIAHQLHKTASKAVAEELFDLPPHWCWATAETVVEPGAEIVYGIVQPGPKLASGVPYVRGTDIEGGRIKFDQLLFTSAEIAARYERASLRGGDILLGIIRATKVAIVPDELTGGNITQGTARFRPSGMIRTSFLARWLESRIAQGWLHSKYRGIDMPGLNLRDVRRLPVPVPPIEDQQFIETRIETAFAWIDRLASEATSARRLIDRLDQAVLAKAFRGELVPQDPDDEPASVLLDRIKAERGSAPKAKRGRKAKS